MKFLRKQFDKIAPNFEKGGKFEKLHPVYDAFETLAFVPKATTGKTGAQIRDAVDMKRMMMTVIIAMVPCLLYGMWNVGHQHYLGAGNANAALLDKFIIGAWVVLPVVIVAYASGLAVEFFFAVKRGHSVNEGFLVSGMLIPLVMPPTVPLWQVAIATIFAVIVAKEVFGGTGMNILNVAMTARAFLYFAYPVNMAGNIKVWTYFSNPDKVAITNGVVEGTDGYTGATALGLAADLSNDTAISEVSASTVVNAWNSVGLTFENLLWGAIPGSIGETSFIMCIIGALILIATGVGSWKIIVSGFAGAYLVGLLFNVIPGANAFMAIPAHYHLFIGGLAFGIVFMATDPVSAAQTELGKWYYGFLIGALTVLIRVFNPAYPEGIMLAVLLMNVFAPLIDHFVVEANKKRRLKRAAMVQAA